MEECPPPEFMEGCNSADDLDEAPGIPLEGGAPNPAQVPPPSSPHTTSPSGPLSTLLGVPPAVTWGTWTKSSVATFVLTAHMC